MFKRISEVIDMQNTDSKRREYEDLVRGTMGAVRSLSADDRAGLQAEWQVLTSEIRQALEEDPAGAQAQALGVQWRQLLERLIRQPVCADDLQHHQGGREWEPGMASFVEKPVWDFMTRVLVARR